VGGVGAADGAGQTGFSAGGQMSGAGAAASGAGAGGGVAQPASMQKTSAAQLRAPFAHNARARIAANEGDGMGWVFLEIAVALTIAVVIVWWTMPRKPRSRDDEDER